MIDITDNSSEERDGSVVRSSYPVPTERHLGRATEHWTQILLQERIEVFDGTLYMCGAGARAFLGLAAASPSSFQYRTLIVTSLIPLVSEA